MRTAVLGQRLPLLFLLVSLVAKPATLAERIEQVLAAPAARRAFWGIRAVDLDSGQTLYQLSADHLFTPASNAKLFSTSMALVRLGPEYRFLTRLAASAPPDAQGRIAGNLMLAGGGDPNFSSRVLPYEKKTEFAPNRLAPIEDLADEVAAAGIREIDGNIVGDDTFYVWERYPQGWALDDTINADGAPVTALLINDNTVALSIRPAERAGEPAAVSISPPVTYFTIDNHVQTVARRSAVRPLRVYREPGGRTVHVSGSVAVSEAGRAEILAIDDPALFAAEALQEALLRRSISVTGKAVSRHAFPWDFADLKKADAADRPYQWVLASRASMPLLEDLRVTNKSSQNLHAELVLRAVARERRGIGSIEAGLDELKDFLKEAGIGERDVFFRDGSGLSRMDLVSPQAVTALLAHMWHSPQREAWLQTLPVAGDDGTIRGRFVGTPAATLVQAKTGTLTHVSALSGYMEPPGGGHIAFSVLVNGYTADAAPIRALIDRICLEILRSSEAVPR